MLTRYPNAAFKASPHHSAGHAQRYGVVLHIAQGGYAGTIQWFLNPASKVSSHFVISGTGEVTQMVDLANTAWTNGLSYDAGTWYNPRGQVVTPTVPWLRPGMSPNRHTITIEHAGWSHLPRPAAQQQATIALLAWLARQLELTYEPGVSLLGHYQFDPVDRAACPGPHIDLAAYAAAANAMNTSIITAESTICAPPRCTPQQALTYLLPHTTAYTEDDVRLIVRLYFDTCTSLGVDPCVAIAQLAHETGRLASFWSQRPQRNPAGLGVTGQHQADEPTDRAGWAYNQQRNRWEAGLSFGSWNEAVLAHVGRLLAYAGALDTVARIAAATYAATWRELPDRYVGSAPTLRGLGGTWATDAGYGERVAAVADAIARYV